MQRCYKQRYKIYLKMEKKINIRGAIRMLKQGEFLEFTREQAKPSYLRSACSALTQDYRYSYSVNTLENGKIRVTRNA